MPAQNQVVAIIDDDMSMLNGLSRLLNISGFQTERFSSAEAFLGSMAVSRATCLVLDIQLSGMSGIELRRRLLEAGSKLSVIFMTGIDDEMLHRNAMQAGCVALLHKPFPASLLVSAIAKASA